MKLDAFPVKGAAVVGYFVELGEAKGDFYFALVEQSSSKQYSLRFSDNIIEKFHQLTVKNSSYKEFYLLGYVSMSDYKRCYDSSISDDKQLPPIFEDPCQDSISAFNNQARAITRIKKIYSADRSRIPDEITNGMPITFVHVYSLDEPVVVDSAFTRIINDELHAKYNENLSYVPSKFILRIGGHSRGS